MYFWSVWYGKKVPFTPQENWDLDSFLSILIYGSVLVASFAPLLFTLWHIKSIRVRLIFYWHFTVGCVCGSQECVCGEQGMEKGKHGHESSICTSWKIWPEIKALKSPELTLPKQTRALQLLMSTALLGVPGIQQGRKAILCHNSMLSSRRAEVTFWFFTLSDEWRDDFLPFDGISSFHLEVLRFDGLPLNSVSEQWGVIDVKLISANWSLSFP